jgi:hypothetical protein
MYRRFGFTKIYKGITAFYVGYKPVARINL